MSDPPASLLKVLLVEDDVSLRGLAAESLSRAGFDVVSAGNGKDAVRAIDPEILLIVLDWNVPEPSGNDLIEALIESGCPRGFVVVTGEPVESLPLIQIDVPVEVLRKPYRPYELVSVCLAVLGGRPG